MINKYFFKTKSKTNSIKYCVYYEIDAHNVIHYLTQMPNLDNLKKKH